MLEGVRIKSRVTNSGRKNDMRETATTVSGAELPSRLAQFPDRITIEPVSAAVTVSMGGKVIARSTKAVRLHEGEYAPMIYVPRADADMSLLTATDHSTYCPFKGEASYFSVSGESAKGENAVWSYEDPFVELADIKDHLAFYTDRITVQEG